MCSGRVDEATSLWNLPESFPEIDDFCNKLKYGIRKINDNYQNKPNLCKEEFKALHNLRKNNNLVIKPVNKGGGITAMNSINYEAKMTEHLSNTAYLQLNITDFKPNGSFNEYLVLIYNLEKYLTNKQYKWLPESSNKIGTMYGLPKKRYSY